VLPFLLRHRRHWPWVLSGLGAAYVAQVTIRAVLERVGHAGATLDDSYIHFQYARAIAEGHPFRFQAGMPPSSGGTSMLWPLALAVFYAVGFRGDAIMWAAWILSYAAYAGLAYEAYAVTKGLASRAAGVVAAVLVLTFGGLQWFAASGMEVLPFAYAMLAAVRHAAEWSEAPPNARSTKSLRFPPRCFAPRAHSSPFLWPACCSRSPRRRSSSPAASALWPWPRRGSPRSSCAS
jgi:hypothetical protein